MKLNSASGTENRVRENVQKKQHALIERANGADFLWQIRMTVSEGNNGSQSTTETEQCLTAHTHTQTLDCAHVPLKHV